MTEPRFRVGQRVRVRDDGGREAGRVGEIAVANLPGVGFALVWLPHPDWGREGVSFPVDRLEPVEEAQGADDRL